MKHAVKGHPQRGSEFGENGMRRFAFYIAKALRDIPWRTSHLVVCKANTRANDRTSTNVMLNYDILVFALTVANWTDTKATSHKEQPPLHIFLVIRPCHISKSYPQVQNLATKMKSMTMKWTLEPQYHSLDGLCLNAPFCRQRYSL